ncbi:hypothetical protein COJ45_18750 [Bacillus cereus]|nr:hypothetical protein COJ45_18750 [Bacillus cereus]
MVDLLKDLSKRLDVGYTAMACVDIIDLPFNMYYEQFNSNHYIEISQLLELGYEIQSLFSHLKMSEI